MSNRRVVLALCLLLPLSANASGTNASSTAGMFTFYYALFIVIPAFLIHLGTTVYFSRKRCYHSKAFTTKYVIGAMLIPIMGAALLTFEYLLDMSATGIHVGTFLSILFVYGFLSLVFAIPYLLHLMAGEK